MSRLLIAASDWFVSVCVMLALGLIGGRVAWWWMMQVAQ